MGAVGMPVGTGRVVRSIAGRDAGVFYVVLEDRDGRVLHADGTRRPLQRPQSTTRPHIRTTNTVLELSGAATNKMLRRALRPFYENEGGEPLV